MNLAIYPCFARVFGDLRQSAIEAVRWAEVQPSGSPLHAIEGLKTGMARTAAITGAGCAIWERLTGTPDPATSGCIPLKWLRNPFWAKVTRQRVERVSADPWATRLCVNC